MAGQRGLSDGGDGGVVGRGVHRSRWLGPNGEVILFALDHRHWEIGERTLVPWTADQHALHAAIDAATEALWERLEARDPMHNLELFPHAPEARP